MIKKIKFKKLTRSNLLPNSNYKQKWTSKGGNKFILKKFSKGLLIIHEVETI